MTPSGWGDYLTKKCFESQKLSLLWLIWPTSESQQRFLASDGQKMNQQLDMMKCELFYWFAKSKALIGTTKSFSAWPSGADSQRDWTNCSLVASSYYKILIQDRQNRASMQQDGFQSRSEQEQRNQRGTEKSNLSSNVFKQYVLQYSCAHTFTYPRRFSNCGQNTFLFFLMGYKLNCETSQNIISIQKKHH